MTMQGGSRPICPNCGQDNELDSRFCRNCGNALALTCARCGQGNEAGSNYCRNCGNTLTANTVPASSVPAPAAARAALVCPRCQHRNEPESQFCYNCGLPLTEEGGRVSTARPGLQAFALGRPFLGSRGRTDYRYGHCIGAIRAGVAAIHRHFTRRILQRRVRR